MSNKRKLFWDIVKGIGIISIVIGHVTPSVQVHDFVYMYHLAIFYFVGAYFYNEQKYGDDPVGNFAQRLKTNWPKYVFYSMILSLLHNTFIKYHLYSNEIKKYETFKDLIYPMLDCMTFKRHELFASALWFVFTIIFAIGIFGIIVYIARKISSKKYFEKYEKYIKYIIIIVLSSICGILGVYLNKNQITLNYHIHTSFLILPICALGYFIRKKEDILEKFNKFYVAIPILIVSTGILIYITTKTSMKIELSKEMIINGIMFYVVTFIGLAFCLSLSAIIEKIPKLNKMIALLGKHSFAIMALHFAVAKGIDAIYSKMINETNPEIISRWVTTYPEKLWIIYIFAGCIIPLIFSIIIQKIKELGNGESIWKKKT